MSCDQKWAMTSSCKWLVMLIAATFGEEAIGFPPVIGGTAGFLLSVSKSMRKAEDDMLLSAFSLGKVIQNGGKAEKSLPASSLEHYKIEDSSFLNEEEDGAPKFSNTGLKHHVISHSRPLNLPLKQLPYFSLEEPAAFPAEAEVQSIESIQERRETGDDENSAKLPIGRRDFDMLRCMLGRVYRPCWQV